MHFNLVAVEFVELGHIAHPPRRVHDARVWVRKQQRRVGLELVDQRHLMTLACEHKRANTWTRTEEGGLLLEWRRLHITKSPKHLVEFVEWQHLVVWLRHVVSATPRSWN